MKPNTSKYFNGSYCACGSRLKYISAGNKCVPCWQAKARQAYRDKKRASK